jgi:hypothetical protein
MGKKNNREVWPRYVENTEGERMEYFMYLEHDVGDIVTVSIAAPGYGYHRYKVLSKNDQEIVAELIEDRSGELTPDDVR